MALQVVSVGQVTLIAISVFAKGKANPLPNLWKTSTLPGSSESFSRPQAAAGRAIPRISSTKDKARSPFMSCFSLRVCDVRVQRLSPPGTGRDHVPLLRHTDEANHPLFWRRDLAGVSPGSLGAGRLSSSL